MKKIYAILAVAAVAACTAFAVSSYSSRDPFFEANVEALTETEKPDYELEAECHRANGNFGMASVCQDSGFETAKCKVEGEISIFGVTISGSYESGRRYRIPWARYTCVDSNRNCCIKQGLYTGENKLA